MFIGYTDGGCRGNPGPGAWAFILESPATGHRLERANGEQHTTNNRMEMLAAINCLHALKHDGAEILLHSDSRYLIDCCTQWMTNWKRNGWRRKDGPLKNVDLLEELDRLLSIHTVRWQWVKGHAGNPGNERVDQLANQAMDRLARGEPAAWEQRSRMG